MAFVADIEILPRLAFHRGRLLGYFPRIFDPKKEIEKILEEHGKILFHDMDGILQNRPQLDLIKKWEGKGIWVDAGVRFAEGAMDLLVAGAEKVVLGTRSLRGMGELKKACDLSEDIIFEIDFQGETLQKNITIKSSSSLDLIKTAEDMGIDICIFFDESGIMDSSILSSSPVEKLSLYAGLVKKSDVSYLKRFGIRGAVVDISELI